MPAYISHIIMAKDVLEEANLNNVNLDTMMTYSLGGDLSKYAKCRYDSHHKFQRDFIYNMAMYIKENKLFNNKDVMGVLYGHICHYVMDDTIHPMIRKVASICKKCKNNHTMVEMYLDDYLVKHITNKSIREYARDIKLDGKLKNEISDLLNYAYLKTYNTKNITKYYKFNIFLYNKMSYLYKILNTKLFNKLLGYSKFMNNNANIDLVNMKHDIKYKDGLNRECSNDFITLYSESVENAIKYIKEVDKYIKNN